MRRRVGLWCRPHRADTLNIIIRFLLYKCVCIYLYELLGREVVGTGGNRCSIQNHTHSHTLTSFLMGVNPTMTVVWYFDRFSTRSYNMEHQNSDNQRENKREREINFLDFVVDLFKTAIVYLKQEGIESLALYRLINSTPPKINFSSRRERTSE